MKTLFQATAFAAIFAVGLFAQNDEPRRGSDYSGPGLGVARVSMTDGTVRIVRPSGADLRAQAGTALVQGDRLISRGRSRVEVQFDGGNFLRLGADTEVRIGELGNKRFEAELVLGVVSVSQFERFEADVDIETTLADVRLIKPGVFVVEHHGSGQTDVTVRDGAVEVWSDDGIEKVKNGMLSVRGDPDDVSVVTAKAEPRDGFDDWAKRRDKLLEREGPSSWRRWVPDYVGVGFGYPYWGYPWGWGPRYRTTVVYRTAPRGGFRGGRPGRSGSRRGGRR